MADLLGFDKKDTPEYATFISNTKLDNKYNVEKVQDIPNDTIYAAVTLTEVHALTDAETVYITGVTGSASNELINSAGGYSLSLMTSSDQTNLQITDEELTRSFKIPIQIGRTHQKFQNSYPNWYFFSWLWRRS
jgi:hypothetical protein